jgi:membrane protein YdbS with pleckstrin-like domain
MLYQTKKDRWLVLIVALGGVMLLVQVINLIMVNGFHYTETWILFVVSMGYLGILILLAYPVHYEITTTSLEIRNGILLHYKIPLSSIVLVVPTRSPLSSPAWSLDRLKIDYVKNSKKRVIMISPKDKKTFLLELVERTPSLKLTGNMAENS